MSDKIAELRALLAAAAPGPWVDDDGNVISRPLSEARQAGAWADNPWVFALTFKRMQP